MNDARAPEAGCREPRAPFHPYWHALLTTTSPPIWRLVSSLPYLGGGPANGIVIGHPASSPARRGRRASALATPTYSRPRRQIALGWHLVMFNPVIRYPNEKIFFQSFFMLMTVQFFSLASA